MTNHEHTTTTTLALFTLAEIKAAAKAFDQGDVNVLDTLDVIHAELDAFRAAAFGRGRREAA